MESKEDMVKYFDEEAIKLADGGFLSNEIRFFVRDYYRETHNTPVSIYALFNTFKKFCEKEVKESYFRGILEKSYVWFISDDGIQYVHLNQQKKLRIRRRKV